MWGNWSSDICKEQRAKNECMHAGAQLAFSRVAQFRISCLGTGTTHSEQIFHLSNIIKIIPSQTCPQTHLIQTIPCCDYLLRCQDCVSCWQVVSSWQLKLTITTPPLVCELSRKETKKWAVQNFVRRVPLVCMFGNLLHYFFPSLKFSGFESLTNPSIKRPPFYFYFRFSLLYVCKYHDNTFSKQYKKALLHPLSRLWRVHMQNLNAHMQPLGSMKSGWSGFMALLSVSTKGFCWT